MERRRRRYDSFILMFVFILAVLLVCIDVSTICVVCARLAQDQYVISLVNAMLVVISWINILGKLPIYATVSAAKRQYIKCHLFEHKIFGWYGKKGREITTARHTIFWERQRNILMQNVSDRIKNDREKDMKYFLQDMTF